jgi:hypothetical protein
MAKRLNPGRASELPKLFAPIEYTNPENNAVELWVVTDRGDQDGFRRWKLCAEEGTTVLGKANYNLNVRGTQLFTNDAGSKLKKDRPGLFAMVELLAAGQALEVEPVATDVNEDPYGDLAVSRSRPLTQPQQWNRVLLGMRRHELHWELRPDRNEDKVKQMRAPSWENGIRQAWFAVFRGNFDEAMRAHKTSIAADAKRLAKEDGSPNWHKAVSNITEHLTHDMPREAIDDAVVFITRKGPKPGTIEEYLKIISEAADGKYAPMTMQTIAKKFDQLVGLLDPDDFEAVKEPVADMSDFV